MKRRRAWGWMGIVLAGVFASCGGNGGDGQDSPWLSVSLARAVDQQLNPAEVTGAGALSLEDPGTHTANGLQGVADREALVDAVRQIEEGHFGGGPGYQLPSKEISAKLSALAAAATPDYGHACETDNDADGIPDVKEPLGQGGLCLDPGSVSCSDDEHSFTIKFSDCVVARGGSTVTTTWGWPWGTFWQTTGVTTSTMNWNTTFWTCTSWVMPWCGSTTFITVTSTITPITSTRWTSTTTSGGLSPTFTITGGYTTPCYWGTVSTAELGNVRGWVGGSLPPIADTTIVPCTTITVPTTTPACFTWKWSNHWTEITHLFSTTWADVVYQGEITLHSGAEDVDEQALYTRYNHFTKLWDVDGTGSTDTNPYLTYNGEVMEYYVLTLQGLVAEGSTCVGRPCSYPDGMVIEDFALRMDRDGDAGSVYQTGDYQVRRGTDFEDGAFIFSGAGSAIVLSRDKQGNAVQMLSPVPGLGLIWGPAGYLVGQSAAGLPVYALSLYDRDSLPELACGDPMANPCWVQVELNSKARTFSVLEAVNCSHLDLGASDWSDIPF